MRYKLSTFPLLSLLFAAFPALAHAEMPAPATVEAAGAEFPYVTAGEGEPVLFVHGSVADYRIWAGLWDDVARDHRVVALASVGSAPATGQRTSRSRVTSIWLTLWRS